MTDTTIDAGELLHIAEEQSILEEIRSVLEDYNFSDEILEDTVRYPSKIAAITNSLDMDSADADDVIDHLQNVYDVELEALHTYGSVYDLVMDIATAIYRAEEAEKAAEEAAKIAAAAAQAAIKPTPAPATPVLGVLLLPSLETHGRFIALHNVSVDEARTYARDFTNHVVSKRKTKNFDPTIDVVDDMEFFHNVIDFTGMTLRSTDDLDSLEASLQELKVSDTPKVRGLRALYIARGGVVGVGTTVIYNPNWATKNYADPDMIQKLQDIQESFTD